MSRNDTALRRRRFLKLTGGVGTVGVAGVASGRQGNIQLGHLAPFSGGLGWIGPNAQKGVAVALSEVNSEGLLGREVAISRQDTETNPQAALSGFQTLDSQGVVAIIGPSSTVMPNLVQPAQNAQLPIISTIFDPQVVWNGIVVGSIIAVAALGLTLVFGILNFINIAYGDYMALGAYLAFAANVQYDLNIVLAALLGTVGMAVGALALDRLVFRPFRSRSAIVLLVVSIGLAFVLRNAMRVVWGTSNRRFSGPIEAAPEVFGIRVLPDQVVIVVISLVILGGTYLLLRRTRIGIAMRATSEDSDLARVRGVDTERLVRYVWLVGGAIAGIAGILLGLDAQLRPNMGFTALIPIFAAVILGGIGDPVGAVVGGYAIGIAQEVSVVVIPPQYKPAIGLVVLIVGLLTKPDGLFGEATR